MKFFFSLFLFLWVPLFMCAQDSGVTTKDILRYYKIASPEEKQSIMKRLVETYDIDEVKVFEPSLNDIFVEYAGAQV